MKSAFHRIYWISHLTDVEAPKRRERAGFSTSMASRCRHLISKASRTMEEPSIPPPAISFSDPDRRASGHTVSWASRLPRSFIVAMLCKFAIASGEHVTIPSGCAVWLEGRRGNRPAERKIPATLSFLAAARNPQVRRSGRSPLRSRLPYMGRRDR